MIRLVYTQLGKIGQLAKFFVISSCCALVLIAPTAARATVIFSNLGSGSSYDTTGGNIVGDGLDGYGYNYALGGTFTPTANYTLGSFQLALNGVFGSNTDVVNVALTNASAGLPGSTIESFSIAAGTLGLLGNNNPLIFENSILNPLLSAGTQYWITVSTAITSSVAWNWNNIGDTADVATSLDGGSTWGGPYGQTPGAFEVDSLSQTSVPEPSTMLLLVFGLAGLAGFRKKFKS